MGARSYGLPGPEALSYDDIPDCMHYVPVLGTNKHELLKRDKVWSKGMEWTWEAQP